MSYVKFPAGSLLVLPFAIVFHLIAATGNPAGAAEGGLLHEMRILESEPPFQCILLDDFGMQGVRIWHDEAQARAVLGPPERITESWGEDDGGGYDLFTWHYDGFDLDIVRGRVDRLYTASPVTAMAADIHPGLSRAEVIDRLGGEPERNAVDANGYSLYPCPDLERNIWAEGYVTLVFDAGNILQSIEFAADRP